MGTAVLVNAKVTCGVNCFQHLHHAWLAGGERRHPLEHLTPVVD